LKTINILTLPVVHFKHFIDFFPNPKGNIDEISGSSFRIRGKKLEISHFLVKYSHNAQRIHITILCIALISKTILTT